MKCFKTRALSVLLAVLMLLPMTPATALTALAADHPQQTETAAIGQDCGKLNQTDGSERDEGASETPSDKNEEGSEWEKADKPEEPAKPTPDAAVPDISGAVKPDATEPDAAGPDIAGPDTNGGEQSPAEDVMKPDGSAPVDGDGQDRDNTDGEQMAAKDQEAAGEEPAEKNPPKIQEGSKVRETTKTDLVSYTVGSAKRTPASGIYKVAVPTDTAKVWVVSKGAFAALDCMAKDAEPALYGEKSDVQVIFDKADVTSEVVKAFGKDELEGVADKDARLRLLEVYASEADYKSGNVEYAMLLEYSYVRPTITVRAEAGNEANPVTVAQYRLSWSSSMEAEPFPLPGTFFCEGNTAYTDDTPYCYVHLRSWDTDKYEFIGWRIEGKEPVGADGKTVTYGSSSSGDKTFADYFEGEKGSYTVKCKITDGEPEFSWKIVNGMALAKDMTVEPAFREKTPMENSLALMQTEGGSISQVRVKETETHTLTSESDDGWYFERWEQSGDGGKTWSAVEELGAAGDVTLSQDTSFRAVFKRYEFAIAEEATRYELSSDGEGWALHFTMAYPKQLADNTSLLIKVYEGDKAEGAALEAVDTLAAFSGRDTQVLRVPLEKRPGQNAKITFSVLLGENGYSQESKLQLCGTLDVTPAAFQIDTAKAIFLGQGPASQQLTAVGSPTPAAVAWSSSNSKYPIEQETGIVKVPSDAVNVTYTADAGDGRIAVSAATFSKSSAAKFAKNKVILAPGNIEKLTVSKNSTRLYPANITLTNSDETVVKASVLTRMDGKWEVVDKIEVEALTSGAATLTIKYDGKDDLASACQIIVPGDDPIDSMSLSPTAITLDAGESQKLSYDVEPEAANVSYTWSTSDATVAAVDSAGKVTGKKAGEAVITLKVTDLWGKSLQKTCKVTVKDDPYQVKVYVPKGVDISFYPTSGYDNEGHDTFVETARLDEGQPTDENGYELYRMELPSGTYSFRGRDGETDLGGGLFKVPAAISGGGQSPRDNCEIYLRRASYGVNNEIEGVKAKAADFTAAVDSGLGANTIGDPVVGEDGCTRYQALLYVTGNVNLYYVTISPSKEYGEANRVAAYTSYNQAYAAGTDPIEVLTALPKANVATINAPAGAAVGLYKQIKNYNTAEITDKEEKPLEDGTVDHIYRVSSGGSGYSYRVSMDGKATRAGFIGVGDGTRVEVKLDGEHSPKEQISNASSSYEASTLLNLNDRNKLSMDVGDTYKVRGYRAAWQIVNTITANIMIEPDFHYTILSGDDVIDIAQVNGGNAGGNWAWVRAKKAGTAIVEVSYDSIEVTGIGTEPRFYGASDSRRTGVFVVTVGGDDADIGGISWDAEYNTCYFLEEQGTLNVNPSGGTVSVEAAGVYDGVLGEWQSVKRRSDGFNLPIANGNNVVKITSDGKTDYRVIRGSQLVPSIESGNADGKVYPGDKVTLSFKGLYQPAPKFSGIYNPGFGNTMRIGYRSPSGRLSSSGTQYALIDKAGHQITFTVPEDSGETFELVGGAISGTSMGSGYGQHRQLTDQGVPANFNAASLELEDIAVPDITIPVISASFIEQVEAAKENVTAAFDRYQKADYTDENWTKLAAAKEAGLTAIDAAADRSSLAKAKRDALTAMASIAKKNNGGDSGSGGINTTHTKSYYSTSGLKFKMSGSTEGYVTISFEDYGKRLSDADFKTPLGVIIEPTLVPYAKGDTIADVTVRLLDALEIKYANTGTVKNSFYLAALQGFKLSDGTEVKSFGEFDSGAGSGWMITQNNWFINVGTSDVKVDDGDRIKWQNTCRLGADIGCDPDKQSAQITGINFAKSYGTLSPKFSEDEEAYIYTVSSSVKSIQLEAKLENYWSIVTYTSNGKKYKAMADIPIENGTVIEIHSSYAEFYGNKPSDTDEIAITIQVSGQSGVSPSKPSEKKEVTVDIKPEVKVENGTAKAVIKKETLQDAVKNAQDQNADKIVIAPQGTDGAKKISVELDKSAVADMAQKTKTALSVQTPVANLTLSKSGLTELTAKKGDTITIQAEKTEKDGAVKISLQVGGEAVSAVAEGIKLELPAASAKAGSVLVTVGADGKETVIRKSAVDGKFMAALLGGSGTVKVVDRTKTFTDVSSKDWYTDAVAFAASHELFSGTSAEAFSPEEAMTRGMLVTVLHHLENDEAAKGTASFGDVKTNAWYADAVQWAASNKIVTGVSEGSFAPEQSVTREQLAVMLYHYAEAEELSMDESGDIAKFTDGAKVSAYAKEAMQWAVGEGLISGKANSTLDPSGLATRAEVAAILQHFIGRVVK